MLRKAKEGKREEENEGGREKWSNLPFELRRKAGDCSRVTAGPIDLIKACVQKPRFLSRGSGICQVSVDKLERI